MYNADDTLKMRFEYADARMPVAMTKDDTTYYLGYDQVGTLKVVADASGNVVKRTEYDVFGNIISDSNPLFAVPFGFAGGLHDRDTGLVRFGYRDYDPETGRWTAKDPILFAGGDTDLYGYCVDDPINLADPNGLDYLSDYSDNQNTTHDALSHISVDAAKFLIGIYAAGLTAKETGTVTPLRGLIAILFPKSLHPRAIANLEAGGVAGSVVLNISTRPKVFRHFLL